MFQNCLELERSECVPKLFRIRMRSNLLSVVKALGEKKICGFPISSCKNLGGVGRF